MLKYFFIQRICSMIYFIRIMLISFEELKLALFTLRISIKSGVAPFHSWVPALVEELQDYYIIVVILSLQKILPFMILRFFHWRVFIGILVLRSLLVGVSGRIGSNSWKKLISYGSIYGNSWIILSLSNFFFVIVYLIIQLISLFCLSLYSKSNSRVNEWNSFSQETLYVKFFSLFTIAGIPPFSGFFWKLGLLTFSFYRVNFLLVFFTLVGSIYITYLYVRMFYVFCRVYTYETVFWAYSPRSSTFLFFMVAPNLFFI